MPINEVGKVVLMQSASCGQSAHLDDRELFAIPSVGGTNAPPKKGPVFKRSDYKSGSELCADAFGSAEPPHQPSRCDRPADGGRSRYTRMRSIPVACALPHSSVGHRLSVPSERIARFNGMPRPWHQSLGVKPSTGSRRRVLLLHISSDN